MTLTDAERRSPIGLLWAAVAMVAFSLNDVIVKFLSGDYALYQLMFIRSLTGVLVVSLILAPLTGVTLKTRRLGLHIVRGLCVVFANFTFFLGLAALPLADAVAIFFISPLLISVFSVIFLGETVGPRRWAAIAIGLVGVLIVLRPGTSAFQFAALLPLAAAFGYAMLHILTRKIGGTENPLAMVFYIQSTFLAVSITAGLTLGHGAFNTVDHPSARFLLSAWIWPATPDLLLAVCLGLISSFGGYCISEAYRRSEAALIAPVEYVAMPLAVFFGLIVFNEWPDAVAWTGITLILASGLVFVWREAVARRTGDAPKRLQRNT